MINSLSIKNVALIKSLKIDFFEGLNILSGETGAGKSIIIDSLSFVLGGKADKTMIRDGEDGCEVSALLELPEDCPALAILEEMGLERDTAVLLKRTLDGSGKGKCHINGESVPVAMLKNFTSAVCDIHGQSEHHSLLKVSTHLELIDKFGFVRISPRLNEVAGLYKNYREIKKQLAAFGTSEADRERLIDLLRYQIDEIEEADIKFGELDDLNAKRTKLLNLGKLLGALKEASELLGGMNVSAFDMISSAAGALESVSDFDAEVETQSQRLRSVGYDLQDVTEEIDKILDGYDLGDADEVNLNRLESRIETIKNIHKKYGKTFEDVQSFLDGAHAEYDRLTKSEKLIAQLSAELIGALGKLKDTCLKLTEARRQTARELETAILLQLKDLGLKNAKFEVVFSADVSDSDVESRVSASGCDTAEFYMSANLGQPLKPLVKVISGGEASRFMLALKTITSDIDRMPLLVFDEIDTGISGEIAQMVSKKFARIAKNHQLLAITHLPQIAAMGDHNYLIEKHTENGDTVTQVNLLGESEKENEIARLAGGNNIGEYGVLHARELIAWCDDFKNN